MKVDRMSMPNSLEVRCPLLDHELAELAAQIRMRGSSGTTAARTFSFKRWAPLADWFREPLRAFLWDHLTSRSFVGRGTVSPFCVLRLLDEHDRGRRDDYHHLWNLLMLEL